MLLFHESQSFILKMTKKSIFGPIVFFSKFVFFIYCLMNCGEVTHCAVVTQYYSNGFEFRCTGNSLNKQESEANKKTAISDSEGVRFEGSKHAKSNQDYLIIWYLSVLATTCISKGRIHANLNLFQVSRQIFPRGIFSVKPL